jgi:hypothetical protein
MKQSIKSSCSFALSIAIIGFLFVSCGSGDDQKKTVGMCHVYMDTPEGAYMIHGTQIFCTSPTTDSPECTDSAISQQYGSTTYATDSGQIGTYDDYQTCEDDLDAVAASGDLSPGPNSNENGGSSDSSGSGNDSYGSAGCSTTTEQLESKCMKEPSDVYDNCTLECNPVCVFADGCSCGIPEYCDSIAPKCDALKNIGCTCSWCP